MFRIVLCDDSPADLMVLCGHLEQLQEKRTVDIISYTDGLDLLKDYKQKGFCDILVLDMRMETMGGIEVAKHIRQLDDEVDFMILFRRYILLEDWPDIAVIVRISRSQMFQRHSAAIKRLDIKSQD